MKVTLTHKGWFGICPIYLNDPDVHEIPNLKARHWAFEPVFVLSEWIFTALFFFAFVINPDLEAGWPINITGTLPEPIVEDWPDDSD